MVALQPAGISQDEQELQLLHAGAELGVGGDAVGVEVGAVDVAVDFDVVGELEVAEDDDLDVGCDVSLGGWVFLAE